MARRQQTTLLPPTLKEFLLLRSQEIVGCCLIGLGIFMALAIISYDATDPSLNTAVNGEVRNLAGHYGSLFADIGMQIFGGASLCLAGAPLAWGRLKFVHKPLLPLKFKIACTFLATIFISLFLAAIGETGGGLDLIPPGGAIGKVSLDFLQHQAFMASFALSRLVIALSSFVAGVFLLFYAYSLKRDAVLSLFSSSIGVLQVFLKAAPLGFKWALLSFPETRQKTSAKTPKRERVEPSFSDHSGAPQDTSPISELLTTDQNQQKTSTASSTPIELPQAVQTGHDKKNIPASYHALNLDEHTEYQLPPLTLLSSGPKNMSAETLDEQTLESNARLLRSVLEEFGIRGEIVKIRPGPVVTLYELVPAPGIKTSRVISLADDIARSMSAVSARVAVISGQNAIGIELPNQKRQSVFLRELLSTTAYERTGGALPLILGKDIGGSPVIADLARMPHLLVAGTTGSGKSVAVNSMILSLLFRLSPEKCKLIMIDPKMLELSIYDGIPHLLSPVVTDPKKAVVALKWTVREMEERYRAMSKVGVRNIEGYNLRLKQAEDTGEALTGRVQTGFDAESGKPVFETQALNLKPLPYIVVVVDEMADLMLVAGKDIEAAVQRLAQMARAAGIHLIMATQRPSVDVITGTIKANFPTRISFQVTSKIDSRTILGEQGAEQLLGQGDMLYMAAGGRITRVHGPFVSDNEVEHVVQFLKLQGYPEYVDNITEDFDSSEEDMLGSTSEGGDLYQQAVALVLRERKASTSFVQRHLQIGYNRAARLIEMMEKDGIVSAANHVGKREILREA